MAVGVSARDRRARLRAITAEPHQSVDRLIEAIGSLAGIPGYTRYLTATHRARAALEAQLTACGAALLYSPWPTRQIAHLIEDDLTDLQAPIPQRMAASGPPVLSDGAIFGALYVLEGSALGARIIAQRVAAFGMLPGFGGRHLAHQAGHPRAWPDFLTTLECADLSAAEEEACLHAATDAFDCFIDHYMTAV
jgi:heme oxygenase